MRIEQRYKSVSGGKGKLGAQLWSGGLECLLGFVRELGDVSEAARGGIPFDCVDCAANTAPTLCIGRRLFKLERVFVEYLQHFLGGLKKELPQIAALVVARGHGCSSSSRRWYAVLLSECNSRNLGVSPSRLSACPTNRYPLGRRHLWSLSTRRRCSASSK